MTKTKTKEQAEKDFNERYFLLKCPHCGAELLVRHSDLNKKMYKPHNSEYEYYDYYDGKLEKKIGTQKVSSDASKDVFKNIKCCQCGHVWNEPVQGIYTKACHPSGKQTIMFELDEIESKRAKDFIEKHSHKDDLKKENKVAYTSLGHQFTYSITPGGFGPLVSIKCNYCGESENITNSENW